MGPDAGLGVFGSANMGILTAIAAESLGADVTIVEISDARRKQAADVPGLTIVSSDQFNEQNTPAQIDIAIDCSGSAKAVSQAIRALGKGGNLVILSLVKDSQGIAIPLAEITCREIDIRGAWLNPGTFAAAITLASKHAAQLQAITTRLFDLTDVVEAFACAASQQVHKVIVRA